MEVVVPRVTAKNYGCIDQSNMIQRTYRWSWLGNVGVVNRLGGDLSWA